MTSAKVKQRRIRRQLERVAMKSAEAEHEAVTIGRAWSTGTSVLSQQPQPNASSTQKQRDGQDSYRNEIKATTLSPASNSVPGGLSEGLSVREVGSAQLPPSSESSHLRSVNKDRQSEENSDAHSEVDSRNERTSTPKRNFLPSSILKRSPDQTTEIATSGAQNAYHPTYILKRTANQTITGIAERVLSVTDNQAVTGTIEKVASVADTAMKAASMSPESVGPTSKPLTYTTVGSVVKGDEAPNFAPPVRIHREGANRRPIGTMISNRSTFDGHNSRPYSHAANVRSTYPQPKSQFEQSHHSGPPLSSSTNLKPLSSHAELVDQPLTAEEEAVFKTLGIPPPRLGYANTREQAHYPTVGTSSQSGPLTNITNAQKQNTAYHTEESDMGPSDYQSGPPRSRQGALAGVNPLNKMQTVQRLAQYPNPMQEEAKNRLAEFSVARTQQTNQNESNLERALPPLVNIPPHRGDQSTIGKDLIQALERYDPKGELDMGYRFPNPLPTQSAVIYSDESTGPWGVPSTYSISSGPSNTAQSAPGYQQAMAAMPTAYPQTHQGYPQPLTAGPPGNRFLTPGHASVRPTRHASGQALVSLQFIVERRAERSKEFEDEDLAEQLRNVSIASPSAPAPTIKSPWNDTPTPTRAHYNNGLQPKIYDTSTPADIAKYYNGGRPSNYNYEKPPYPTFSRSAATFDTSKLGMQNDRNQPPTSVPSDFWAKTDPSTALAIASKSWYGDGNEPAGGQQLDAPNPTDDWWFSGLRRIGMTAEEHLQEFEDKNWRTENGYPEPSPPSAKATDNRPWTREQIDKMSLPEMMKGILDTSFGTFLSIADQNPGPAGALNRSRLTEDRYRDDTAEGNKSLFGEDWGETHGQAQRKLDLAEAEKVVISRDKFLMNHYKPEEPAWKKAGADGRREGRQLWKKNQDKPFTWTGPRGFEKERGLDRGVDLTGMVDFQNGGAAICTIPIPPNNPNKTPAQRVGSAVVPHSSERRSAEQRSSAQSVGTIGSKSSKASTAATAKINLWSAGAPTTAFSGFKAGGDQPKRLGTPKSTLSRKD